jgi:hypothetical protein
VLPSPMDGASKGSSMLAKRIGLFVLLGPPLGFVMAFWVMLPLFNAAVGEASDLHLAQLVLLPLAYAVGAAPAGFAGLADHALAGTAWRPLWSGLVGYVLGFVPIIGGLAMGTLHGRFVLLFGLIGAVPAVVCSLLASRLLPHVSRPPQKGPL